MMSEIENSIEEPILYPSNLWSILASFCCIIDWKSDQNWTDWLRMQRKEEEETKNSPTLFNELIFIVIWIVLN